MELFTRCNNWLGRRMFLFVLFALALGFISRVDNSAAIWNLVIILFAYMTFITALETSLNKFLSVLRRPLIPLWILFLAHIATPLIAWVVGYAFFPADVNIRIGYLISAAIPVGVTSIIWTSLVRGNVAISLVTVALDTLIVPVLLPLFFLLTVGAAVQIDYRQMAMQLLLMITIPSIAGMWLHDLSRTKAVKIAKGIGGFTSKLIFYLVIYLNAAVVAPLINWDTAVVKMILVTLLMVVASYSIGYLGSLALKKPVRDITAAMVYNVGLRNISAGLVLAMTHFPPPVAVPITLFILFQQPMASVAPYLFKLKTSDD